MFLQLNENIPVGLPVCVSVKLWHDQWCGPLDMWESEQRVCHRVKLMHIMILLT